ncbi:MAG: tetratricopeptide repeat protein [Abditibacteriales bacterium]|nr:tetratricopeptide repeat protein [Abditibacteriales bacterium]MDW8364498.1 tetratricopeptide repeat protein [Abditibacteriales bacterium]
MTLPWRSQWSPPEAELSRALARVRRDLPLLGLLESEEIARKYPGTPVAATAQCEMGLLLSGSGWLEEAQSAWGKLTAAPSSPDPFIRFEQMRAQLLLGVLYQRRGRGEAARLAWREVLTDYKDPGLKLSDGSTPAEMADFQIGVSYLAEGQTQQGVAYLREFIQRRKDCYLARRAVTLLGKRGMRIGAAPPSASRRRIAYGHPVEKNPQSAI